MRIRNGLIALAVVTLTASPALAVGDKSLLTPSSGSSDGSTLFNGSNPDFVVVSGDTVDVSSVTLPAQANSIDDAGSLILGSGGLTTGTLNVSGALSMSSGGLTAGAFNVSGTLALGSSTATIGANNADSLVSGTVSGSGGVIKNGTGTLSFSSNQTYTGTTLLQAGTLASGNNAGISLAGALTQTGGTLAFAVTPTAASAIAANSVTLSNGALALNFAAGSYSAGSFNLLNAPTITNASNLAFQSKLSATVSNAPANLIVALTQTGTGPMSLLLADPSGSLSATKDINILSTPASTAFSIVLSGQSLDFLNASSAGHSSISGEGQNVNFFNQSSASNATVNVLGVSHGVGNGILTFYDQSTAASAVLSAKVVFNGQANASSATINGDVTFNDTATATAPKITGSVTNRSTAVVAIASVNGGSITTSGTVQLGGDNSSSQLTSLNDWYDGFTEFGDLTKTGSGALTVTGNTTLAGSLDIQGGTVTLNGTSFVGGTPFSFHMNAYEGGSTTIQNATLVIGDSAHTAATFTGPITVAASGVLSGFGTIKPGTNFVHQAVTGDVVNNGTVAPAAAGTIGALTVNNYNQSASGKLQVEISSLAASRLNVTNVATLSGAAEFNFDAGSYNANTYTVLTAASFAGSGFTSTVFNNVPAGFTASLLTSSTQIQLILSRSSGSSNPNTLFDGSFPDFVVVSGDTIDVSSVSLLAQANSIDDAGTLILGNSGLVTGALNVSGALSVGTGGISMGANNSDSLITGTISGSTGLIKQGTGTLTISSNQSYTGTTQLRAGTLAIGNATGITLAGGLTQTGGTLAIAVTPTTASGVSSVGLGQGTLALNFAAGSYSATTLSLFNSASIAYGTTETITANNAPSNLVVSLFRTGSSSATSLNLLDPTAALAFGTWVFVATPSSVAWTAAAGSTFAFLNSTTAGTSHLTGTIDFYGNSSAGTAVLATTSAQIIFHDASAAGSATLSGTGNAVLFLDQSSAGSATINSGVTFYGTSSGGTAHVTGAMQINGSATTLTIGAVNGTLSWANNLGTTVILGGDNSNSTLGVSISTSASPNAGLTKVGSGTMTTSGLTMAGPLAINGGTAILNGNSLANAMSSAFSTVQNASLVIGDASHASSTFTGPINVGSGATLSGLGTIQSGTFNSQVLSGTLINNGTVAPGQTSHVGALTVAAYSQATDATLEIEVTPVASDRLVVGGTAFVNGVAVFDFDAGSYGPGTYSFLTASNIAGGGFTSTTFNNLPSGFSASISQSATQILLILSGSGGSSAGSALFDGSFPDFVVASGDTVDVSSVTLPAQANSITDAGTLLIGNGGLVTGALNVSGALSVGSGGISMGANNTDSLISGTVSGSTGLVKQGTGTLTISSNQSYTGTTQLRAGTLAIGNATGITLAGALTQTGGTLAIGVTPTAASAVSASAVTLNQGTLALNFAAGSYSATTLALFTNNSPVSSIAYGVEAVTASNAPANLAVTLYHASGSAPTSIKLLDPSATLAAGTSTFVATPASIAVTSSDFGNTLNFLNGTTAGTSNLKGTITFYNQSSAANSTITTNTTLTFRDGTTAANANITGLSNNPIFFRDQSSAANATINGSVYFYDTATGGTAHFTGGVQVNTSVPFYASSINGNLSGGTVIVGGDNSDSNINGTSGNFTKVGAGTLTSSNNFGAVGLLAIQGGTVILNGSSGAGGNTPATVQNARLVIGAAGHASATYAGPITVGTGGTLSGFGAVQSQPGVSGTVVNDGTVAPGQVGTIGVLTAAAYVQNPDGTLQIEVTPLASSRLVVENGTVINGSAVFNFDAGSYGSNTYSFLTAASIGGGGFTSTTFNNLPSGFSASLTHSTTQYQLVLSGPGSSTAGASLFDGSFPDFVVATGTTVDVSSVSQVAQANSITDAGTLLIGSGGLVTGALNVSGALSVGAGGTSMGANNSDSLVSGTISGSGSLVKQGTGTLTISSNQSFTGLLDFRNGTLAIGNSTGITLAGNFRQIGGTFAIAVTPTSASGISTSGAISLLTGTLALNFAPGTYSAANLPLFTNSTIAIGSGMTVTASNAPSNLVTLLLQAPGFGTAYSIDLLSPTATLPSGHSNFLATPSSIALTSSNVSDSLRFLNTTTAGHSTLTGTINFNDQSTAGNATLTTNTLISFLDTSSAGSATIFGSAFFSGQSSAGNATVNNTNMTSTTFAGSASGGTAHVNGHVSVNTETSTLTLGAVNGTLTWLSGFGTTVILGGDNSNSALGVSISSSANPDSGLTKVGTGTMTTSGLTMSGPLSIQAGTAVLNGDSLANSNSSAFTTVQNANLVIGDASHTLSFFTGPISVDSGGTLSGFGNIKSGTFGSHVLSGTVINNGTVAPGQTGTIGALTVAAYSQSTSGVLEIEVTPLTADQLTVGGTALINGSAVFDFDAGTYDADTYVFLTASNFGGGGFTSTTFNNLPTGTTASIVTTATQMKLVLSGAGNNNSGLLFDGSNPDFIVGTGATVDVSSVTTPATAHSITDMGTLLLGSGGLTTGALNVSGSLSLGSGNATVGGDNTNSLISGTVSGSGGLTKAGSGTLTITGTASYTGGTTIQAGTVQIGNGGASGSIAGDIVDNATLAFNSTDGAIIGDTISGTGAVTRTGSGWLALTGTNTYAGGTTVSDGVLYVGFNTATGSVAGNIANNGSLYFYRTNDYTFGGVISGAGTVFQYGTGTLTLTGTNTNSGGFVVQSGTVEAASSQALGTSTFELYGTGSKLLLDNGVNIANDVQIDNPVFINVNGSDSATISGALIGSAPFEKDGTGTLTLNHDNTATYSGDISYHGTLVAGVSGAFGTGTVTDLGSRIVLLDGVAIDNRINLVDDMTVAQDGGIALLSGSIGETGGSWNLIKSGGGTLLLTGNSSFTGLTTISGGSLQVEGSIASSRGVIVDAGGTLQGSGTVGVLTVASGGQVAPGTAGTTATLTANGDVTFASGSSLLIDRSTTAADRLTVNGVLNAGGSLALSNVGGYVPHYGDAAIIASANSISGAFDPLPDTIAGVLMPTLSIVDSQNGQQAVLKIAAQSFFTQFTATTADQMQVATTLDGARASHFNDLSGLYNAIDPLTGSTLGQALENLAPDAERAIGEVGNMQSEVFSGMLWQHLGDIGGGSPHSGFHVDASNLKLALASVSPESNETQQFVQLGSGLSTNPGGGNDAVSVTPAGGDSWLGFPGGSGGFLSGSSLNGSVVIGGGGGKADVRGFVIGAGLDLAVGDNLVIGGSLGMAQSSATLRAAPATLQDDSIQGAAYARYDFADSWILEGFAGYGSQTIQTRRLVTVGGTTTLISGHTGGSAPTFGGYLGKAFDVPLSGDAMLTLVPSASVQYLRSEIDPFSETGGPAALTFAGWSEESTLGRFGMDARTTIDLGGVHVTPAAHLFWVDDLSGSNGSIQAAFAGAPSSVMSFALAPHDNSWGELGFGADFDLGSMLGSQATLSARYDATVGREQIQYSAWTGRLMIRF